MALAQEHMEQDRNRAIRRSKQRPGRKPKALNACDSPSTKTALLASFVSYGKRCPHGYSHHSSFAVFPAAIITIAMLVFGPFAQQAVIIDIRNVPSQLARVSIPDAVRYHPPPTEGFGGTTNSIPGYINLGLATLS